MYLSATLGTGDSEDKADRARVRGLPRDVLFTFTWSEVRT